MRTVGELTDAEVQRLKEVPFFLNAVEVLATTQERVLYIPGGAGFLLSTVSLYVFQIVLHFPSYGINGLGAQAFTKLSRKKRSSLTTDTKHRATVFFF